MACPRGTKPISDEIQRRTEGARQLEERRISCSAKHAPADRVERTRSGYAIRICRRGTARTKGNGFHQLPAFGWRGEALLETGTCRGRRQTVLLRRNAFANQRQSRTHAPGRPIEFQSYARRVEPNRPVAVWGRRSGAGAGRPRPGVER